MSTAYFSAQTMRFFRDLARHNERAWFHANKPRYEQHVRDPFLRLIGDLAEPLRAISPHMLADPKTVGGSLFRIQRDTRFSSDKAPYKTWAGARFAHARGREVPAPVFYLHVQPGNSFLGGGVWHPEPAVQRRIREFIVDNPDAWKRAVHAPAFRRRFAMDGDSLVRAPRGFDPEHPLLEDLKRKDFVASQALDDTVVTGPRLRQQVAAGFAAAAPLLDYLCAALELDF